MLCRPRQTGAATRTGCSTPCCKCRKDESGVVASKHCKKHTCEHFHSPSPGASRCEKSKDPSDSVCSHHVRCPIGNCNKARMQKRIPADEPKFKREKYCGDHKCSLETCAQLRNTLGTGQVLYRPYCNKHACHADGCTEKNTEPRSVYCTRHNCQKRTCGSQIGNDPRYCENHNRCEWSLGYCVHQKRPDKELCVMHLQCDTDGCDEWKDSGSKHCQKHTCHERKCDNSSGNFDYCSKHRCEYRDCGEHRAVAKGGFCARHVCQKDGCKESRGDKGIYCGTHSCTEPECGNEKVFRDLCDAHYQCQCERNLEVRWNEDRENMRFNLEMKDQALRTQYSLIRERDDLIQRLQERDERCGDRGCGDRGCGDGGSGDGRCPVNGGSGDGRCPGNGGSGDGRCSGNGGSGSGRCGSGRRGGRLPN
ncbi:hypothetical protein F4781DRAFT_316302 [Annulohypoxylon bovei var. microspora]|nr:hypothetical protein F4781DRAFT_316302 [Annulohypoxylon bovei var. microspora]